MIPFDYQPITRMVFGPGTIASLGKLAAELGGRRAMVVSDSGVIAAGHAARGIESLAAAGLETVLYQGVHENPSTEDVEKGTAFAREFSPDILIGLGGGSSMDCAKGINFLLTNGGRMQDYWGVGKAKLPMLPMIAVPTTSGTGSESQSFALISDAQTHAKMACGDKKAAFKVAILDPVLTLTQPPRVTALTGIDAISHALESHVTTKRNAASQAFSREAWRLLARGFTQVLRQPGDLEARGDMQLGACLAGLAIENSMLGATHALANPLTAEYGIAHGQAIGLMLPHVLRFNGHLMGDQYVQLLEAVAGTPGLPAPSTGVAGLANYVASLVVAANLPVRLLDCHVERDRLPKLAEFAAKQWTGTFNPRPVGPAELLALYEDAY
jgi:alcohol dehydrogenase